MKDKKLKVGTLCTVRAWRNGFVPVKDKGYWVVTAIDHGCEQAHQGLVKAFSLKYQHHYWWKPDDLIPVVNSGG